MGFSTQLSNPKTALVYGGIFVALLPQNKVIAVLGAAKPHCAYLFANRRANRAKVLMHDGFGIWLAGRRLNQGRFHWLVIRHGSEMELDTEQLQALVLGLPWQRMGSGGAITLL